MKLALVPIISAVFATTVYASTSVTPISDLQRGAQVTVSGTVERITDEDEFRLSDQTGSVRVYIGPNWVPASVGETVVVTGLVDDGLGPLEIYARTLVRETGEVIEFRHRYD